MMILSVKSSNGPGEVKEKILTIINDNSKITYKEIGEKTGFDILGRFDDFTLNPGSEKSDRVHFVFQRRVS